MVAPLFKLEDMLIIDSYLIAQGLPIIHSVDLDGNVTARASYVKMLNHRFIIATKRTDKILQDLFHRINNQ